MPSLREHARLLHNKFMPTLDDFTPHSNCLNILHHNAQSLKPKLKNYVALPNLATYDIVTFSETWFKPILPSPVVTIPDYTIFRTDRSDGRNGGGVAIYMRSHFEAEKLDFSTILPCCESLWVKVKINTTTLIIATIYLAPSVCKHKFFSELSEVLEQPILNHAKIVITGDLNINWNVSSKPKTDMLDIAALSNLKQTVIGCSFISPVSGKESLLDLCFVSNNLKVAYSKTLTTDLSDHYAVMVSLELGNKKPPRKIIKCRNFQRLIHLLPHKVNTDLLKKLSTTGEVNQQVQLIEDWINSLVEKFAPLKKLRIRPDSPKWLTPELKRLVAFKNRFYKRVSSLSNEQSFEKQWDQYKKFRNHAHSEIRRAKRDYYAQRLSKDAKTFYNELNPLLGKEVKKSHKISLKVDNNLVENPIDVANTLNQYFTSIDSPEIKIQPTSRKTESNFKFTPVTQKQVKYALCSLKSGKRGGLLKTPTEVYKALHSTLVPAMTQLINTCFSTNSFPDVYKVAIVTPLYKKGDPTQCGNYRPISSLPILSKVIETVMSQQIKDYIEDCQLLSQHQFGFRKHTSTSHMLHFVLDKIAQSLDMKKPQYVMLLSIDIKKAFDTVNHSLLIDKLRNRFSFDRNSVQLMQSYLENRKQSMAISGVISDQLRVTKGVPQGSILGPLLFNLMVNDMLTEHNYAFSYADDTVIVSMGDNQQQALDTTADRFFMLQSWYKTNGLTLCVEKSHSIVFSNRTIDWNLKLGLGDIAIPLSTSLKLLGVTIDSDFTFTTHVEAMTTKAKLFLYALRKIRHLISVYDAKLIYTSIVRSKLEYCCTLFAFVSKHLSNKIESCQNKAIRIISKAPRIFSVTDGRRLLNLHSLVSRRSFFYRQLARKISVGACSTALYDYVIRGAEQQNCDRVLRSNCSLITPSINKDFGRHCLKYNTIKILKEEIYCPTTFLEFELK